MQPRRRHRRKLPRPYTPATPFPPPSSHQASFPSVLFLFDATESQTFSDLAAGYRRHFIGRRPQKPVCDGPPAIFGPSECAALISVPQYYRSRPLNEGGLGCGFLLHSWPAKRRSNPAPACGTPTGRGRWRDSVGRTGGTPSRTGKSPLPSRPPRRPAGPARGILNGGILKEIAELRPESFPVLVCSPQNRETPSQSPDVPALRGHLPSLRSQLVDLLHRRGRRAFLRLPLPCVAPVVSDTITWPGGEFRRKVRAAIASSRRAKV